jgi:SAM-dependent methyltransferase
MGAEVCLTQKTAMGEPLIEIAAPEAYKLWSSTYDDIANPLLALEMRILRERIGPARGCRFIDVATGTGRWAAYAAVQGAVAIGLDLSRDMLKMAAGKPLLGGRLAVADMCALPIADSAANLAVCSFGLSYVESIDSVIAELARVARKVVISDLHPMAVRAGWARSFRFGSEVYRIRSYSHSFASIDRAATDAGMEKVWEVEASLGMPEERFFLASGKQDLFAAARETPAIFARCWSAGNGKIQTTRVAGRCSDPCRLPGASVSGRQGSQPPSTPL